MDPDQILVENFTYADLLRYEQFGWKAQIPPIRVPYKWEICSPKTWTEFPQTYQHASFVLGALYVLTIYGLQRWMKNRPPFNLNKFLFLWNLGFSVFTIVCVFRTLPVFVDVLGQPDGFYQTVCLKEGGTVTMLFWTMLFFVSKFFELGDTIFIILRKRPLKFLHWYHHLCTMLVMGIVAPMMEPIGRWYMVLNSIAHSLVYPYLALKVLGIKVPQIVAKGITTLQLGEMLAGFLVNITSLYFLYNGRSCARYPLSIVSFLFVYGTFIMLFGKLFYDSVVRNKRKDKKV